MITVIDPTGLSGLGEIYSKIERCPLSANFRYNLLRFKLAERGSLRRGLSFLSICGSIAGPKKCCHLHDVGLLKE